MIVFGKTNRLARKTKFFLFLIAFKTFTSSEHAASKFEANQTFHLQVTHASLSLLPLACSCLNDDFHVYAIIDFLANQLVSPNTVTHV